MIPKFRIVQFGMGMPGTGHLFFIDWQIEVEKEKKILWGLYTKKYKELIWDRYIDPTRSAEQQGYMTLELANHAINVYKKVLTPVYHYVE